MHTKNSFDCILLDGPSAGEIHSIPLRIRDEGYRIRRMPRIDDVLLTERLPDDSVRLPDNQDRYTEYYRIGEGRLKNKWYTLLSYEKDAKIEITEKAILWALAAEYNSHGNNPHVIYPPSMHAIRTVLSSARLYRYY